MSSRSGSFVLHDKRCKLGEDDVARPRAGQGRGGQGPFKMAVSSRAGSRAARLWLDTREALRSMSASLNRLILFITY